MKYFLGIFGAFICLSSLLLVAAAIEDLVTDDPATPKSVLVGLVIFFLGTAAGGGYLAKRKLFPDWKLIRPRPKTAEQTILDLALAHQGRLTIAAIAAKTHLSVAQAKAEMEALCRHGVAEVKFDEDGDVHYLFAGLEP